MLKLKYLVSRKKQDFKKKQFLVSTMKLFISILKVNSVKKRKNFSSLFSMPISPLIWSSISKYLVLLSCVVFSSELLRVLLNSRSSLFHPSPYLSLAHTHFLSPSLSLSLSFSLSLSLSLFLSLCLSLSLSFSLTLSLFPSLLSLSLPLNLSSRSQERTSS